METLVGRHPELKQKWEEGRKSKAVKNKKKAVWKAPVSIDQSQHGASEYAPGYPLRRQVHADLPGRRGREMEQMPRWHRS